MALGSTQPLTDITGLFPEDKDGLFLDLTTYYLHV